MDINNVGVIGFGLLVLINLYNIKNDIMTLSPFALAGAAILVIGYLLIIIGIVKPEITNKIKSNVSDIAEKEATDTYNRKTKNDSGVNKYIKDNVASVLSTNVKQEFKTVNIGYLLIGLYFLISFILPINPYHSILNLLPLFGYFILMRNKNSNSGHTLLTVFYMICSVLVLLRSRSKSDNDSLLGLKSVELISNILLLIFFANKTFSATVEDYISKLLNEIESTPEKVKN